MTDPTQARLDEIRDYWTKIDEAYWNGDHDNMEVTKDAVEWVVPTLFKLFDQLRWENTTLRQDMHLAVSDAGKGLIAERNQLRTELRDYYEALEKIADPRKRDHKEPDCYTELGCVMTIAAEALAKHEKEKRDG